MIYYLTPSYKGYFYVLLIFTILRRIIYLFLSTGYTFFHGFPIYVVCLEFQRRNQKYRYYNVETFGWIQIHWSSLIQFWYFNWKLQITLQILYELKLVQNYPTISSSIFAKNLETAPTQARQLGKNDWLIKPFIVVTDNAFFSSTTV